MNHIRMAFLSAVLTATLTPAFGWQLSPEGSFIERKLAGKTQGSGDRILSSVALYGVHVVGESVHEEITNRILGCEGDADICAAPEFDPDFAYYLAGVRWNDDPPFRFSGKSGRFSGCTPGQTVRLVTQPRCWGATFRDAKERAEGGLLLDGSNSTLLARSHFGDLQFLHAMATADAEAATTTQTKIMAWSEFVWRLSQSEYDLETPVANLPIPGFDRLFETNVEWRVQDLFALGNPHIRTKEAISKVAFGSLLHMMQDSFAEGHVERRPTVAGRACDKVPEKAQPGKIVEFHSYTNQNSESHGIADSRASFSVHWSSRQPTVVNVGKELLGYYQSKSAWSVVQPYVECVFALDDMNKPASAGAKFAQ